MLSKTWALALALALAAAPVSSALAAGGAACWWGRRCCRGVLPAARLVRAPAPRPRAGGLVRPLLQPGRAL